MLDRAEWKLREDLGRLTTECQVIGQLWEAAARRMIDGEALPPADLIERLGRLRSEWDGLLADASTVVAEGNRGHDALPDPAGSLLEAVAFVEQALASRKRREAREAVRGVVLDRLSRVTMLVAREGSAPPKLADLRAEAMALVRLVDEAQEPELLGDFAAIADGTHRYCQLLDLVEPAENPGTDRNLLLIDCAWSFGPEIAKAVAKGELLVSLGDGTEAPETEKPPVPTAQAEAEAEAKPGRVEPEASPETPPVVDNPSEGALPAPALPESGPDGPAIEERTAPIELPKARPLPSSRRDSIASTLKNPVSSRFGRESNLADWRLNSGALTSAPTVLPFPIARPSSETAKVIPIVPPAPEPPAIGRPAEEPLPELLTSGPVALEEAAVLAPDVAEPEEILDHCRRGDYLGASLLAVGRAFAGLPEGDPGAEALLVAHHVASESPAAPWPDWREEPEFAAVAFEEAPEASRLILLAALVQVTRAEFGADPLSPPVMETLLTAFNHLPELRGWLDVVVSSIANPGLWERLRRQGSPKPSDGYQPARAEFLKRYNEGRQLNKDTASYIHRQNNYLSRLPATKLLQDHLGPVEPGTIDEDARRSIREFLEREPEKVTGEWLKSTAKAQSSGVQVKGNDRADLVREAATYLGLMNRAWLAAEAMRRPGPPPGEVDRLQGRLRDTLAEARNQARQTPWEPLFATLTERFSS
jgi:hypothetical protein